MKIKKVRISPKILLLIFPSQRELAITFLRIQEHYESPGFKGKIFTHEEFKDWYIRENGKWSYYREWSGYNIPSIALKKFYQGKFNPLINEEKQLISLLKKEKNHEYIIAFFSKYRPQILQHEIAHALYHLDKSYRKHILKIINKYDTIKIRKKLTDLGDYHPKVFDDEIQAYAVSGYQHLKVPFNSEMKEKIRELFQKYKKDHKIEY